ncbi:S8 family serine peptidase [Glaciimonas sp. PCH181]|uniref:PKD domain-containing protein n=1 Tax=Glaciimonas sp. PCH181 TaxID=2133943 RepID=UPI0013753764|nr:S8 family serine peptidase [Glaciimonas sp. PCH181]
MKIKKSLWAVLGAIACLGTSSLVMAQDSLKKEYVDLVVRLKSNVEDKKNLTRSMTDNLSQLKNTAPSLNSLFTFPAVRSAEENAKLALYRLSRYYHVDISNQSVEQAEALLKEIQKNPLVEEAYLEGKAVAPAPSMMVNDVNKAIKNIGDVSSFPDYQGRQYYLQDSRAPLVTADYKIGGVNALAAWDIPGGDGKNSRIVLSEPGHWSLTHDDLPQPFLKHWNLSAHHPAEHATNSAGIMVSQRNGFGTTGIAYAADMGYSRARGPAQLFDLGKFLVRGDLIQMSLQMGAYNLSAVPGCYNTCLVPIEYHAATRDVLKYLTHEKGIHVVIAAGNGGINLDAPGFYGVFDRNHFDSGAIYVGAVDPRTGNRIGTSNYGSRVDTFSWGSEIVTTGYLESGKLNGYTFKFGGTSGASPIVAGAAAVLQSVAIEHGMQPIGPIGLRNLLTKSGYSTVDGNQLIGVQPDLNVAIKHILDPDSPLAPVAHVDGSKEVLAGQTLMLSAGLSSNANGSKDGVTYQWRTSAGTILVDPTDHAQVQFIAPTDVTVPVMVTITLEVSNAHASDIRTHTVNVKPQNGQMAPLTARIGGENRVIAGSYVPLSAIQSTGPEGAVLSYDWSGQGLPEKNIMSNPTTGGQNMLFIVPYADVGTSYTLTVNVSDGERTSVAHHTMTVVEDFDAPVAALNGPATAKANDNIVLTAEASKDPDGKPLTYEWQIPAGIQAEKKGPLLRFVAPALNADQTFLFGVKVSNGATDATVMHTVKVFKKDAGVVEIKPLPGTPPQAIVGGNITVVTTTSSGFAYKLDGSKSLRAAKYEWKKLSGPFSLRNADKAIAEAIVGKNQTGVSVYQLTVTDKDGKQHSSTVNVSAVATNATISGPASIVEGQTADLKAQANFAGVGGSAPAYSWKVRNASGVEVLQGSQQHLSLSGLRAGNYQATVDVSSPHGGRKATAQRSIVVEKKAEITPPVAVVTGPRSVEAGASVTLSAAGSSASGGGALRYDWKVSPQLPFNANGAKVMFTAPKSPLDKIYTFTVSVREGNLMAEKSHSVLVHKVVETACNIPQWEAKSYKGGIEIQRNGRSYTAKWYAESHHVPGSSGWTGEPWKDNGVCK